MGSVLTFDTKRITLLAKEIDDVRPDPISKRADISVSSSL
jgi:hypothetical protein